VDLYNPPSLAIEVASTTLSDDLGQNRLLYERMGVQEYWVVNVEASTVIAFAIAEGGSRQIPVSAVLPGLSLFLVEEALQRSQTENDGAVNCWFWSNLARAYLSQVLCSPNRRRVLRGGDCDAGTRGPQHPYSSA
jgi:Putative restriction endonuclease